MNEVVFTHQYRYGLHVLAFAMWDASKQTQVENVNPDCSGHLEIGGSVMAYGNGNKNQINLLMPMSTKAYNVIRMRFCITQVLKQLVIKPHNCTSLYLSKSVVQNTEATHHPSLDLYCKTLFCSYCSNSVLETTSSTLVRWKSLVGDSNGNTTSRVLQVTDIMQGKKHRRKRKKKSTEKTLTAPSCPEKLK